MWKIGGESAIWDGWRFWGIFGGEWEIENRKWKKGSSKMRFLVVALARAGGTASFCTAFHEVGNEAVRR